MALSPQFGSLIPSQTQQLLQQNYLTFDGAADNILSIDGANNRVGIGTAAPASTLEISDLSTYKLTPSFGNRKE